MPDMIKLDYEAMRDMSRQCKATAQRLLETVNMAQQIAQRMQGGALVGDAGEAFSNALSGSFCPSVKRLSEKFEEVSKDIEGAIHDMQEADTGKTAPRFD